MKPIPLAGLFALGLLVAACIAPTTTPVRPTLTPFLTATRATETFTPGPSVTPTRPAATETATVAPSATASERVQTATALFLPSDTPAPVTATHTQAPAATQTNNNTPVASATATSTSTPPDPTPATRILAFGAAPDTVNPGDPVTLEWAVIGDAAELCALPAVGSDQPKVCTTMPVSGTATLVTDRRARYRAIFSLRAVDWDRPNDTIPIAELVVTLNCPDLWLTAGPPYGAGEWNCPAGPARTTAGAAEHFEFGGQYWLKESDEILVYWGGSQAHTRDLPDGQPDSDPSLVPPEGLYQPVRGFGLVWRGLTPLGDLRGALGWATEPEREYTFKYQCNAAPDTSNSVCLVLGPDGYTNWYGLDWAGWLWP